MAEFVTIGQAAEIAEGEAKSFDASGAKVAVARAGGSLYAFSDICTHQGCNLGVGGEIEGTDIFCECHGSGFSMTTGEVVSPPAKEPIATYPVREQDGAIQVEV